MFLARRDRFRKIVLLIALTTIMLVGSLWILGGTRTQSESVQHDAESIEFSDLESVDTQVIEATPVFTPSAAGDDYVDGVVSLAYGTHYTAPPNGMGKDNDFFTTLNEEHAPTGSLLTQTTFSAKPPGWTEDEIAYTGKFGCGEYLEGYLYCINVDTSTCSKVEFKLDITVIPGMSIDPVYVDIDFYSSSGSWNTVYPDIPTGTNGEISVESGAAQYLHSQFKVRVFYHRSTMFDGTFTADNWRIIGYTAAFDATYVFTGVVDYNRYFIEQLHVDFTSGPSDEDLCFQFWSQGSSDVGQVSSDTDFGWNIHGYLKGETSYLRIYDANRDGDTSTNTWLINRVYIRLTNSEPYADSTPISTSDDGNHLYAWYGDYGLYYITTSFIDPDGYSHIDYVQLTCYNDNRDTSYWVAQFDCDSGLFSDYSDPHDYIDVFDYLSTAVGSSTKLTLTFAITINWDHPDIENIDFRTVVVDKDLAGESLYHEVDYDIETRLQLSDYDIEDSSGQTERGDINGELSVEGTLTYYGGTCHPRELVVDIFVSCDAVVSSPWQDDSYNEADGTFSFSVYADDEVGEDTYTFIVVSEGDGAEGDNLLDMSYTDTYIADKIIVEGMSTYDGRINVGTTGYVQCSLRYAYDNAVVSDGEVFIEGYSGVYAESLWTASHTNNSVGSILFDEVTHSGGAYGISVVDQNSKSVTVIWDSVTITLTDPYDQRINLGSNATGIHISAAYDYDGQPFDGVITLNSTTFSYSSVGKRGYTVTSISGDSYGITVISENDETFCIWDSVAISISDPLDQRVDLNANATGIHVSGIYDYDGHPFNGIIALNSSLFSYDSVGRRGYTVTSISGDSYGITIISSNDATFCIWDSVTVTISDPLDQRINLNENASGIYLAGVYDYDGQSYIGMITLNSSIFSYGSVGKRGYTAVSLSGDVYGITVISTNDETFCIWDSVTVMLSDPFDQRIDLNENATGIYVTGMYDYDGLSFDGTMTLNDTVFSDSSVGKRGYTVSAISGGSYGITVISTNDETFCIWDAVEIYDLDAEENPLVDESFDIWFNARLIYDSHQLGSSDTVIIDDISAMWNGTCFIVTRSFATPGDRTFFVNSSLENTYSIDALDVSPDLVVRVYDLPSITEVESTFSATNSLYEGILAASPLWIQWDPVNDPSPPSFNFTIDGFCVSSWQVTSSWSSSVVLSGGTIGESEYQLESALDYTLDNHTYYIYVENQGGYTNSYVVYVTVRDHTVPTTSTPSGFTYEFGSTENDITWILNDIHPGLYDVVGNGTDDVLNFIEAWDNGELIFDVDGLDVGFYNFTLVIRDAYQNEAKHTVLITVMDMTDPTWIDAPFDIIIELGAAYSFDANATDLSGIVSYELNDTSEFTVDGYGIVYNQSTLTPGIYRLELVARDPHDNFVSSEFQIIVVDTTAPMWNTEPENIILELNTTLEEAYSAFDLSAIDDWWTNDSVNFFISPSGELTNGSYLLRGYYGLAIHVNDTHGNVLSKDILITVVDTSGPTWICEPESFSVEVGIPLAVQYGAIDPSGVDDYWVNDTLRFQMNAGELTNATSLAIDTFGLRIFVNDTLGNVRYIDISIVINDGIGPSWITMPTDQTIELGTQAIFAFSAEDSDGIANWWTNNTFFSIEGGVLSNSIEIEVGEYWVVISVCDIYSHVLSETIKITVVDTTAPTWLQTPTDQTVEFGSPFRYDLNATDLSGINLWWIEGSGFAIDQNGLLTNSSQLSLGLSTVTVYVEDSYDNERHIRLNITVQDTVGPIVNSPEDVVMEIGEVGRSITWTAFDILPSRYEILRNGTMIASGEWTESHTSIETSLNGLAAGIWFFEIRLNDTSSNHVMDEVVVLVQDSSPPPTTPTTPITPTAPTDTTTDTTVTPPIPPIDGNTLTIVIAVIGIAGAIILIVTISILRRRG